MYSHAVVRKAIHGLSGTLGFTPQFHSIEEVDRANKELDALFDPEAGRWTRPLRFDEQRWVDNETAVCQASFAYWSTRYAYIRDWKARVGRFVPNVAQRIINDVWADMQEQGHAIAIMQLKARQLGISTMVELAIAHRTQFWPHVMAVVGSSDPDKSARMAAMMELCYQMQPRWLVPAITKYKAGELIQFGGINSEISIQHGTQKSAIARGSTPMAVHLSEIPDYQNPEELIDAGLLKAMHESPWMFLVLESTAKGRGNWWHNTWKVSKAGWPIGRSRLRPIFLPWFIGTDIYPTPSWLLAHPVPANYEPERETAEHARRAEESVLSNDLLKKYLGTKWKMPVEQKWYWEVERFEARAKKELPQFYSEVPATDTEAFQSTNVAIFDTELLDSYRAHIKIPWGVFGIIGSGVTPRISPIASQIDLTRPRINITARWREASEPLKYQLVPLKWNGYDPDDGLNKLYIWEPPLVNEEYGLGCDLGDGVGVDRSVIEVLRKGTFTKNDALVCEFVSPILNSMDMWPICMAIGTLYSVPVGQTLRQPRVAIECRTSGENCQLEMRKQGWKNFHQWVRYDRKRINPNAAQKIGWYTTGWSRDLLMDRMIKYVRDGAIDIFSPWFIDEMNDLERDEGRQRMKIAAGDGSHDDRYIAAGIILVSLHIMEFRGFRQEEAFHRVESSPLARDDAPDEYLPDYARAQVL